MPVLHYLRVHNFTHYAVTLERSRVLVFFRQWPIVSLDKTLIPQLGLYRAFWSSIEKANWTFKPLIPIEVHYIEKNPGMFSSKSLISFQLKKERHEHRGWHGGE